jgi:hypothetical protein
MVEQPPTVQAALGDPLLTTLEPRNRVRRVDNHYLTPVFLTLRMVVCQLHSQTCTAKLTS